MSDYSIGISGLDAAQKALDIIGNNIANAATEGYHRQRIDLSPAYTSQKGGVLIGGGVEVEGVTRMIDSLLEQEILRQNSVLNQVLREFTALFTVENVFGEFSTEGGGLNTSIDNFFNALRDLSASPFETIWQTQAVTNAEAMAGQFRTLGEFLTTLDTQIRLETENVIASVNLLTSQIAELNDNIAKRELGGTQANSLRDQRDQLLSDLSELVAIQTQSREFGVVDVTISDISVVTDASSTELEAGLDENANLGISIAGVSNYKTNVEGGKIGGLLSLKNSIISDIADKLDSLAAAIIQQINQYHVQGVGSAGSFSSLTGWTNTTENLSDFSGVSTGNFYIRVTNTATGAVTRTAVPVDASSDTLTNIATYITNNVANVTASVDSSNNRLTIQADANYKFDFIPAVLPEPTLVDFDDASPPTVSVSGIYAGTDNDTLKFTVKGDGSVGNGTLQLEVRDGDGAGSVIATLNIGSGYAAGDEIAVGDTGIKISLTTGNLDETTDGDNFKVDVFADTDATGLLAAVGINTFFSGDSATNIAVCSEISATPGRIATSLGPGMTDNTNAVRMAEVKEQAVTSLNSLTCGEFYRRLISDIGQQLSIKQIRQDNLRMLTKNLAEQQSEISGVDINDEAAQLLIFEQMFQAMARYLNTVHKSMESLMQLI